MAAAKSVVTLQNRPIVLQNDSLFTENTGGGWTLFFANGWPVTSINASQGKLIVTQQQPSGAAQAIILNESGFVQRIIQQPNVISLPKKGIAVGNDYWFADLAGGLSQFTTNNFEVYKLNSPQNVVLGEIVVRDNVLWATAGTVNSSWNYQYNPSGVFRMEDGTWSAFNLYSSSQLDTLLDFITVAVDPRDNTAWAGSFGGGLLHIDNSSAPKIFKQNSPIGTTIGDPASYRVAGLAFDEENNL